MAVLQGKGPSLTRKQAEVLCELCRPRAGNPEAPCATVKDIAARMFVGKAAVKAHLSALYVMFDVPEAGKQRRRCSRGRHGPGGSSGRRTPTPTIAT